MFLNERTAEIAGVQVIAGPAEATALGNLLVQMVAAGELSDMQEGRECIKNSFPLRTYQ